MPDLFEETPPVVSSEPQPAWAAGLHSPNSPGSPASPAKRSQARRALFGDRGRLHGDLEPRVLAGEWSKIKMRTENAGLPQAHSFGALRGPRRITAALVARVPDAHPKSQTRPDFVDAPVT